MKAKADLPERKERVRKINAAMMVKFNAKLESERQKFLNEHPDALKTMEALGRFK